MIVSHIEGNYQTESDGFHLAHGFNHLNCKTSIIGKT